LGPRPGAAAAARALRRAVLGALRAQRLQRFPLRAGPETVRCGLGGLTPVEALRGPALRALPTLTRWEEGLEALTAHEQDELIARADAIAAHRFDLLGSGPRELGPEIDWLCDFKSGRRWPRDHISRITRSYRDDSDIKVPWELSRFQHLPILAAAHRVTGDRRYVDEVRAQLEHWMVENPVEFGPNWACTMDVAIRAANWVAALALCAGVAPREPWYEEVLASLLLHGRFITSHLEDGAVRGNHYLSDVVGLLPLAALFSNSSEGQGWAGWTAAQLLREMEHQVRRDGCDHEASIFYHRLVCELFICGTQAADGLGVGCFPDWYRKRLDLMLRFVADYARPDGMAPQIGDADDGRFLPLDDYGRDVRSHMHLFRQAGRVYQPAAGHAAYCEGGYYVMRFDQLYLMVRCGDTGMAGMGGHSHNDQLSFELAKGTQPMIIDPGSYLYTADPDARDLFRSTAFHSTLRVGSGEQNEIRKDALFALKDRSRAETLAWEPTEGRAVFEGLHHGFETLDPLAAHIRRFHFDGPAGQVVIQDTVVSGGTHLLEWTFPLAPSRARVLRDGALAEYEHGLLKIQAHGLTFSIEDGWYSPRYGVRVRTPFIRAFRTSRPGRDVTEFILQVG
jgi:hypothetical protein